MVYIRYKTNKSGKTYAYEVKATWDKEKKQSRSKSTYIGSVDADGSIIPKGSKNKKVNNTPDIQESIIQDSIVKDFGDGYLISEFIKRSSIYSALLPIIEQQESLLSLIVYRLCNNNHGSMYNCQLWSNNNVIGTINKNHNLSLKNISNLVEHLGDEARQRQFFKIYLSDKFKDSDNVIIESNSCMNNSSNDFNIWGCHDNNLEQQLKIHCVINNTSYFPLYYKLVPGNIVADVSTLKTTISELKELVVNNSFILLDAGYFSKNNIQYLHNNKIDFLIKLPTNKNIFKDNIAKYYAKLENVQNEFQYGKKKLFIKSVKIKDLYGQEGYLYIILDPIKSTQDVQKLLDQQISNKDNKIDNETFQKLGIFFLISSKKIQSHDIIQACYAQQSIEKIFSCVKNDLGSLYLQDYSDQYISGYLFLQFILLVLFIEIREKLEGKFTVEQALMSLRAIKCKLYNDHITIQEMTKQQQEIFKMYNIVVPNSIPIQGKTTDC